MPVRVRLASGLDLGGNDLVKVRCHVPARQRDSWFAIKESIIKALEVRGCKISSINVILEQEIELARIDVTAQKNDQQLLQDYGKQQRLSPEMLVTGYELLNEA